MDYKEVTGSAAMGFLGTRPTMIVTTLHESGIVNAGVFGSWTNLSGTQIGAAIATTSHTYANMKRGGEFTVNIPGADIVKKIATLAAKIPAEKSELDEAGLTAKDGVTIKTPSIAECVAAAEFEFEQEVKIGHHSFMIGKVTGGWARAEFLDEKGKLDIWKARVIRSFKYPLPLYHLPGEVIEG